MKVKKRLLAVPALGVLFAFGAVACSGGGDDTAALDGWAKNVCDAAKDPVAQSRAALADSAKVVPGEAPADLQKRLSADLAALAKSNQALADAVDKAGAPKTDSGDSIRQSAMGELKQAAQGYLDAQKKLDGLATVDQAKFADGLRSVGDQVQLLSQLSTQGLGRLQSGSLGDAMKKQPGCKADAAGAASGASASPSAAASAPASAPASGAPGSASAAPGSAPASAPAASASPSTVAGAAVSPSPSPSRH